MTLAATIGNVRRIVEESPYEDKLGAQAAAGATSITTTLPATTIKIADVLEFQDAGEQAIATADGTGTTVSVRKGHNDTSDATVASGTVFVKNPRYSYVQIQDAIEEVSDALWPDIWVVTTTTITPSTTADIYNVPSDYEGFIDLVHVRTGTVTDTVHYPIDGGYVKERFNEPTGTLASGKGLEIRGWYRTDAAATLTYKALATTTTMPTALERIVARGVAAKLLKGEAARFSGQVDIGEQSRVRNLLQSSRFLEDEFERQTRRYAATLAQEAQVRRYIRARVIGA